MEHLKIHASSAKLHPPRTRIAEEEPSAPTTTTGTQSPSAMPNHTAIPITGRKTITTIMPATIEHVKISSVVDMSNSDDRRCLDVPVMSALYVQCVDWDHPSACRALFG